MGFEIDAGALVEPLEAMGREEAGEAARRWHSRTQEILTSEGNDRGYETFPVVQSALPPDWNPSREAFEFAYTHRASRFFDAGTTQHEIEAKRAEVLAFEWPDAPQEVQDMFEESFPTVFFRSVEVDGIPAMNFMERGRQTAARWLEGGP